MASTFDGVLANFIPAYQALTIEVADGVNLFEPGDIDNPPCWNWPEYRGYSAEIMKEVWRQITESRNFWWKLIPYWDNTASLALCIEDLEHSHDVYFITSRPGLRAKRQTESWLRRYLPYDDPAVNPTVLLSSRKGHAAAALKLDAYIDDNLDNVRAVLEHSPGTRVYLLDRNYNQGEAMAKVPVTQTITITGGLAGTVPVYGFEVRTATRINTLGEMLTRELVVQ